MFENVHSTWQKHEILLRAVTKSDGSPTSNTYDRHIHGIWYLQDNRQRNYCKNKSLLKTTVHSISSSYKTRRAAPVEWFSSWVAEPVVETRVSTHLDFRDLVSPSMSQRFLSNINPSNNPTKTYNKTIIFIDFWNAMSDVRRKQTGMECSYREKEVTSSYMPLWKKCWLLLYREVIDSRSIALNCLFDFHGDCRLFLKSYDW